MKTTETAVLPCSKPPLIDGDLSDHCWQDATALEDFYIYRADGKTSDTSDAVKALVAFDDEWLYFGS